MTSNFVGQTLKAKDVVEIAWSYEGIVDSADVEVYLCSGMTCLPADATISEGMNIGGGDARQGHGKVSWTIPAAMPTGDDYYVCWRIRSPPSFRLFP